MGLSGRWPHQVYCINQHSPHVNWMTTIHHTLIGWQTIHHTSIGWQPFTTPQLDDNHSPHLNWMTKHSPRVNLMTNHSPHLNLMTNHSPHLNWMTNSHHTSIGWQTIHHTLIKYLYIIVDSTRIQIWDWIICISGVQVIWMSKVLP